MIVVDTSVLVAILQVEPEARVLVTAMQRTSAVGMSAVTLLEAGVVMRSKRGPAGVVSLERLLVRAKIALFPFNEAMARIAIEAFSQYGRRSGSKAKLNFGDCASYALAKALDVPLLFKGDDFSQTDIVSAL